MRPTRGATTAASCPTCAVADDFQRSLGDANEKLTVSALAYLRDEANLVQTSPAEGMCSSRSGTGRHGTEPGAPGHVGGLTVRGRLIFSICKRSPEALASACMCDEFDASC